MVDFIRQEAEAERLNLGGLREEEDIFASVWASARNRWTWLAINLVTAFIASRVISIFEGTIEKLVALATLMPIVAGIGGNSGNQTITMIVRALALGQITPSNAQKLLAKEIVISLLNGLVWGGIVGMFAMLLYKSISLGLVMTAAMTLNLLVAALVRRLHSAADGEIRARSGGRLERVDHGDYGQRRFFHFPRAGHVCFCCH